MGQTTSATPALKEQGRIVPNILADFIEPMNDGTMEVEATILDKKKLRFSATIVTNDPNSPNPAKYTVANANGKVRTFTDIDSVVRLVQKVSPGTTKVQVTILATNSLNPAENLSNPQATLTKEKTVAEKAKVISDRELLAVNAELISIGSFQNGTPTQQAKYADVTAQKNTLMKASEFYAAEIARITPLLTL